MLKLEKKPDSNLEIIITKNIPMMERTVSVCLGLGGIMLIFFKRPDDSIALYGIGVLLVAMAVIALISQGSRFILFDRKNNVMIIRTKKFFRTKVEEYALSEIQEIEVWTIRRIFILVCTFKDGRQIVLNPEDKNPGAHRHNPANLTEAESEEIGGQIADLVGVPLVKTM